MTAFTDNLAIISRRFPLLAAKLKETRDGDGIPLKIEKPLAALWAQTQIKAVKPDTLYVVSGLGNHVEAIMSRMDPSGTLLVYEASIKNMRATLSAFDSSYILNDPRVILMGGVISPADFELLHQLPVSRIQEVLPLRYSPVWQQDEKTYASFFAEAARQFDMVRRLHMTSFNDALLWQACILKNLARHLGVPDVGALAGLFKDTTAILIGAGPSLDDPETESFLEEVSGRALLIGMNSSYRKLRKLGIAPHLVLAADPRDDTYRGYERQPVDKTFLVAPFIVNPKVISVFKGRAFSWSGENTPLVSLLRQQVKLPQGTGILEKGTVSLSVADLAVLLGCPRLILVGQDMAIGEGGVTHTVDSFYEGFKVKELKYKEDNALQSNARKVPGNTIPEVTTLNNLYLYLKSFELWVAEHPQLEVLNCSRIGAKIAGAPYMSYPEISSKLQPQNTSITERLENAFEKAPEKRVLASEWRNALRPILEYAQKLYNMALTAAVALEALPARLHQHPEHPQIKEIQSMITAINAAIDKNPEGYRVLLEGKLKKSLLNFQQTTRMMETTSPFSGSLTKNKEFFWALVEGIEPALALINEAIELEAHMESKTA